MGYRERREHGFEQMTQRDEGRTIQVRGCKNTAVIHLNSLPIKQHGDIMWRGQNCDNRRKTSRICRAAGRRSSGRTRAISSTRTLNITAVLVLEFARAEYP
jgi:hypothetical protein